MKIVGYIAHAVQQFASVQYAGFDGYIALELLRMSLSRYNNLQGYGTCYLVFVGDIASDLWGVSHRRYNNLQGYTSVRCVSLYFDESTLPCQADNTINMSGVCSMNSKSLLSHSGSKNCTIP
jgi:hypothetical protein